MLGAHVYALTRSLGFYPPSRPTGCLAGLVLSTDNNFGNLSVASTVNGLTIKGAGARSTAVDACRLRDRALSIASGARVSIQDLTITNGHAPFGRPGANGVFNGDPGGPGDPGQNGGGILNAGTLSVARVILSNNVAGASGTGGLGQSSPNTTAGGGGGSGGSGGSGGGIFSDTGSKLTVTDSTLSDNQAGTGGIGGNGNTSSQGAGGEGGSGGAGGNVVESSAARA